MPLVFSGAPVTESHVTHRGHEAYPPCGHDRYVAKGEFDPGIGGNECASEKDKAGQHGESKAPHLTPGPIIAWGAKRSLLGKTIRAVGKTFTPVASGTSAPKSLRSATRNRCNGAGLNLKNVDWTILDNALSQQRIRQLILR